MDLRTSGLEDCSGRLHLRQWAGNLQPLALARHRDRVLHRRPRQYVHSESHVRHKANDKVGRALYSVAGFDGCHVGPQDPPHVSHQQGTELVVEYIEKYWSPTALSDELNGALR